VFLIEKETINDMASGLFITSFSFGNMLGSLLGTNIFEVCSNAPMDEHSAFAWTFVWNSIILGVFVLGFLVFG